MVPHTHTEGFRQLRAAAGISPWTHQGRDWGSSRLSRETNILDISKAVSHSAQSLIAPHVSALLCQNIKLPPALTKTSASLSKPKLPIQGFFLCLGAVIYHEKQKAPSQLCSSVGAPFPSGKSSSELILSNAFPLAGIWYAYIAWAGFLSIGRDEKMFFKAIVIFFWAEFPALQPPFECSSL